MNSDPAVKHEMVYGMMVEIKICRPSRRRASSSIQRRRRRVKPAQGALFMAQERELKV